MAVSCRRVAHQARGEAGSLKREQLTNQQRIIRDRDLTPLERQKECINDLTFGRVRCPEWNNGQLMIALERLDQRATHTVRLCNDRPCFEALRECNQAAYLGLI